MIKNKGEEAFGRQGKETPSSRETLLAFVPFDPSGAPELRLCPPPRLVAAEAWLVSETSNLVPSALRVASDALPQQVTLIQCLWGLDFLCLSPLFTPPPPKPLNSLLHHSASAKKGRRPRGLFASLPPPHIGILSPATRRTCPVVHLLAPGQSLNGPGRGTLSSPATPRTDSHCLFQSPPQGRLQSA